MSKSSWEKIKPLLSEEEIARCLLCSERTGNDAYDYVSPFTREQFKILEERKAKIWFVIFMTICFLLVAALTVGLMSIVFFGVLLI